MSERVAVLVGHDGRSWRSDGRNDWQNWLGNRHGGRHWRFLSTATAAASFLRCRRKLGRVGRRDVDNGRVSNLLDNFRCLEDQEE